MRKGEPVGPSTSPRSRPKPITPGVTDAPNVAHALVLQRSVGNAASTQLLQRDRWKNAPDAKHWKRD